MSTSLLVNYPKYPKQSSTDLNISEWLEMSTLNIMELVTITYFIGDQYVKTKENTIGQLLLCE